MNRITDLERRIQDARQLIGHTRQRLKEYLKDIQKISQHKADANTSSLLEIYRLFLLKEKALFSSLNKLKKEDKLYLGFCWIPTLDKDKIL